MAPGSAVRLASVTSHVTDCALGTSFMGAKTLKAGLRADNAITELELGTLELLFRSHFICVYLKHFQTGIE